MKKAEKPKADGVKTEKPKPKAKAEKPKEEAIVEKSKVEAKVEPKEEIVDEENVWKWFVNKMTKKSKKIKNNSINY